MINYGHSSNTTYFTGYGFVIEEDKYNSVSFNMQFKEEELLNRKEKIQIIGKDCKIMKFLEDFKTRESNNLQSMSFLRFYFSDLNPEQLSKVPEYNLHK